MAFRLCEQDITTHPASYLVHQTNCVSDTWSGLALAVFNSFPWSNTYKGRVKYDVPGSIQVCGEGEQRKVINLMGQYFPGAHDPNPESKDSEKARHGFFSEGLAGIEGLLSMGALGEEKETSFVFPWLIGCGLARGNWDHYLGEIKNFAHRNSGRAIVFVTKLPGKEKGGVVKRV
jgi:hypothetical protein